MQAPGERLKIEISGSGSPSGSPMYEGVGEEDSNACKHKYLFKGLSLQEQGMTPNNISAVLLSLYIAHTACTVCHLVPLDRLHKHGRHSIPASCRVYIFCMS
jgi:hypothetical protein